LLGLCGDPLPEVPKRPAAPDLMAALRASIDRAKASRDALPGMWEHADFMGGVDEIRTASGEVIRTPASVPTGSRGCCSSSGTDAPDESPTADMIARLADVLADADTPNDGEPATYEDLAVAVLEFFRQQL
jgi:hypothetical protein